MEYRSIPQLIEHIARTHPDRAAFKSPGDGQWIPITWTETLATLTRVSKSLIALGIGHGDRVCILSRTRLEWVLTDFGCVNCGGVTVGIYQSNLPPDCAYIVNHAEAELVFVENDEQLQKILSARSEMPQLRQIVIYDGRSDRANDVLTWDEYLDLGNSVDDSELQRRIDVIQPDDLAALVYTSGTTGVPKGVMLTHKNLVFIGWTAGHLLYIEPFFETLLFLPLAHVFARLIVYCCLRVACPVSLLGDLTKVAESIREVRPHFFASVPRIYEKFYDVVISNAEAAGGMKRSLFYWALGVGMQVSRLQQEKRPIPTVLGLKHRLANKLVLHKVQAAFGGRLVYAISGAAPLNKTIGEFFHACGVLLLEGIGMTENTSFSNVNTREDNKFGTVGRAGPGIEVRIAGDGEVLFRGDNVMKGYFKEPEATAAALDAEGWLHTGDIGELDEDGFLKITDRKKEIIVTAGGKNVAPQRIERIMRTSHYIAQVMAYGDKKKYISALITLDVVAIVDWAKANGVEVTEPEELAAHPKIRELLEREVEERKRELASFETVKRFQLLPRDFTIEAGELTPTLKLKRRVLSERYRDELDALYE